ncbi:DEAD/DEAH box helicase [Ancylomarina longa]|uniref:DNA 3'-5' helicase n=1 Tax=Ancylomarina longa TaxID=2487017 RepID=A0A434AFZ1_9BACT|nr:DEAD/DEAH box helicase [Ancylomarina longa]RUT73293.1 DEAD/DEAH box helicase [Ancylomarina longa]
MKQLQAGYIIDSIEEYLSKSFGKEKVDGLLKQLSFFDTDIQTSISNEIQNPEQILFVANNILSRGLPTRISLHLEQTILNTFNIGTLNKKQSEIGSIKYDLDIPEDFGEKLFRAIHIIEPRISLSQINKLKIDTWENHLGSEFEEDFLYDKLPNIVNPFWTQIIESQRELENILRYSTSTEDEIDKFLSGSINLFNEQMIDFSIEFPYQIHNQRGLIVEVDGSQHEEKVQKTVDENRDNATEKAKWKRAIRIKTREWYQISDKLKFFKELENEDYFKLLKLNYAKPLYKSEEGLTALQLLLVPFAIARIQKVIINLLLSNQLDLSKEEWNIAVIERDITGSKLAIDDFLTTLVNLIKLKGENFNLPKINLFVENTDEFKNVDLSWTKPIDRSKQFDLFIDLSILQRSFLQPIDKSINANIKVNIRSSHSPQTSRKFLTTELIKYKALGKKSRKENRFIENENQVKYLEIFVQDIFRKTSFRPGQVEIINRAIQTKSVIGLLPTGSGKSLTYQLTVLLQPGLAIVVDPIKSLMKDQYEGLLRNKIDCSVYINSSLTQKGRQLAIDKINNATTLFAFISPERLQDDTFRKQLIETSDFNKNYFSYCIIDEAHCVSEWGHDFRTSYLRLGDNARNYCKTNTGKDIPFFALTATASYDVLADIQRELKILDDNAIVRLEKLDRPELQFEIKEVVADINSNQGLGFQNKQALGEAKQAKLVSEISEIPKAYQSFMANEKVVNEALSFGLNIVPDNFITNNFFNKTGDENNAGLVFCPHRKWYFGVMDNASNISQNIGGVSVGTFMGSNGEEERDETNEISQSEFIQNKMDLLVATKAFGMGIDKPNIRYVMHFNYPSSIESYYQEAGRAGRDRKIAIGVILFNQQEVETEDIVQKVTENGEITEELESYQTSIDRDLLQSFHRNNFKGIAKEKILLAELLTEIKFPTKRIINQLEDSIIEEFGTILQLRTYTNKNGRLILYLNPNYGSIYLDKEHLPFYSGNDATHQTAEIANFIKGYIQSNRPDNQTAFDWLNQFTQTSKQDGIEKLLGNPDKPDEFIVVIPFANNAKEQIAMFLQSKGIDISERMVDEAQKFCQDIDTFITNLEKQYAKFNNWQSLNIPIEIRPKLKSLFLQIREEQDTFKAIYRLSIIGVIDDYTIDYKSDTISAHISRKRKGHYTKQLKKYLLQYNSIEKVEERLQRLEFYKGNSEIQKGLGFLIKFIYEEIAEQRKEAIKAMEEACKIGLQEDGSQRFKEFIDLYMNSKYARPEYLPSDTEKGLKEDFEIVKKYMELVRQDRGGEINNLKHLRGASTVLLVQRPDNYVFILLKAFTIFIIEKENEDFIKEAQTDFFNGFIKLSKTENEDILSVTEKVNYFKEKLSDFDTELNVSITEIEDILYHKLHTNWIEDFNTKFIGEYERTN